MGAATTLKVQAVISLKAHHRLSLLLNVAGLARSTFFYHQARLKRPDPHAELKAAIKATFEQAKRRHGHRRVHAELVRHGWTVAKKTVLKLMRQLGLYCPVRRQGFQYQHFAWQKLLAEAGLRGPSWKPLVSATSVSCCPTTRRTPTPRGPTPTP